MDTYGRSEWQSLHQQVWTAIPPKERSHLPDGSFSLELGIEGLEALVENDHPLIGSELSAPCLSTLDSDTGANRAKADVFSLALSIGEYLPVDNYS